MTTTRITDDLHVSETGTGDTLVVLVHGVLDRGRSFRRVVELLAPEHRVVTYDRRGYGASVGAPGTPAAIQQHIADVLEILDGRRAVVVGHSFGGVTALGAAAAAPAQVDAVAVYETGLAWVSGWDDTPMATMLASADPEDAGMRLMMGERYDAMTPDERSLRRPQATAFVVEEGSVRSGGPPFDTSAITAPVVYGRNNGPIIQPVVDHLHETLPVFEVVEFADAGHLAHRTHPEAFAGLVRRAVELSQG